MNFLYRLFLLFLITSGCLSVNAQQWQWANKLGTSNSNTAIVSIEKHLSNHLLIAGSYSSANLSLGNLNLQNSGQDDAFFAICDHSGIYNWAVNIGGSAKDYASAIATDQNGNIYLAGNFMNCIYVLLVLLFFPKQLPYCYLVISNVLVNFIPIVKSDGYYAVVTLFNKTNIKKDKVATTLEDAIRGIIMFGVLGIFSWLSQ